MTSSPEPPEIKNIDFSQFHPLDHWPFEKRCYEHFGGPKHHFKLAWTYKWKPRLYEETLCRLGFHRFRPGFSRYKPGDPRYKTWTACVFCWKHQDKELL